MGKPNKSRLFVTAEVRNSLGNIQNSHGYLGLVDADDAALGDPKGEQIIFNIFKKHDMFSNIFLLNNSGDFFFSLKDV